MELEKNLNENKNQIAEKQNAFLKTTFGIAVNEAIDYGLKKVLPDFLENQVIEVKDVLLNSGIKEGINVAIDNVVNLGKSITGIFTGDFKKISQIELAIQKGGIIEETSKVLDKSIKSAEKNAYISNDVSEIIKNSKNIITRSLNTNINSILKEQNKLLEEINICIEKWNKYKNEKDFEKMEKEYINIKEKTDKCVPLEETLEKLRELDNIHNLIKNNGNSFNLTKEQLELSKKL